MHNAVRHNIIVIIVKKTTRIDGQREMAKDLVIVVVLVSVEFALMRSDEQ